ncbi:MAG: hypothetical protein ACKVLM_22925 [Pseudomonadales bacterium]
MKKVEENAKIIIQTAKNITDKKTSLTITKLCEQMLDMVKLISKEGKLLNGHK